MNSIRFALALYLLIGLDARAEEYDLPLGSDHPLVFWWVLQGNGTKQPNVKYSNTRLGKRISFYPLGSKGTDIDAGFDFRMASEGDFTYDIDTNFEVPKGENGGCLAISIPFNTPNSSNLRIQIYPSNNSEPQIQVTAMFGSSELPGLPRSLALSDTGGKLTIARKGEQLTVSFKAKKVEARSMEPFDVPSVPVRPSIFYGRCVPKNRPVHYDLNRLHARSER